MLDERVPSDLKKNLMQARLDKKMTQAQLAQVDFRTSIVPFKLRSSLLLVWPLNEMRIWCLLQMINEKPQVIQEYESGKAIPNQQIIGKLERALGTKLRGKK